DPMSHRIIEKRRRDRMNNCLADLSRLIPTSYLKQGQGRIEKTEIIEMAIRHIKNLQAQVDGKPQTHASSKTLQGNTPAHFRLSPAPLADSGKLWHTRTVKMATTALDVLPEMTMSWFSTSLKQRSRRRGYINFAQGYVHRISFNCPTDFEVVIRAKCRKQRSPTISSAKLTNGKKKSATVGVLALQVQAEVGETQGQESTTRTAAEGDPHQSHAPGGPEEEARGGSGEQEKTSELSCCQQRFYMGFKECQEELMCYLVEGEGMLASEPFCNRISDYLNAAGQRFNVSQSRNEDKEGVQTELENQRLAPSPFHGGPSSQNMLEPLMPLLPNPVSAGMMIPASPVRDKHLRNLLTSRALQQLEGEQEGMVHPLNKPSCLDAVTPQSSTVTTVTTSSVSSTSPVPPFSGHDLCSDRAMSCATSESSLNGGHSSGYFSENSGVDRLSNISSSIAPAVLMTKDSRAINAYKFKHNITKRFSQEGKVISQSYDGSSSASSRDLDDEHQHGHHVKHRSSKVKSRHASSSDSGPYPTSECSSGLASGASHDGSSSSSGGGERNRSRHCKATARSSSMSNFAGSGGDCCSRAALPLPGFVLHPSGTHYMPMSVCHANIPDMFDAGMEAAPGAPVFHPISIPVHFRGPVISMPNINICTDTHGGDACKLADGTAQIKDCKDFK
ncbi:hypothetical protein BaRGS_00014780, partial [Batillaria attramentaria]